MSIPPEDLPVLVTGGTGFVGNHLVRALLGAGNRVRIMTHTRQSVFAHHNGVECVSGSIDDAQAVRNAVRGCGAVFHLVGIIEENRSENITFERMHVAATQTVVDAARLGGVGRFIHMSANGARLCGVSRYQSTKWKAEGIVRSAGFEHWTIFRPSLIFGKPDPGCPEFCSQLVRALIRPFPVWPIFGDGHYLMRPVAVADVVRAFVAAASERRFASKTYCLGGPDEFQYIELLNIISKSVGIRPRPRLRQPMALVRPLVRMMAPLRLLPITPDQLEMLVEGDTCDTSDFENDFDFERIPFSVRSLEYLND
jgi:uncharacterized protein YbjT (DUF2867 family)